MQTRPDAGEAYKEMRRKIENISIIELKMDSKVSCAKIMWYDLVQPVVKAHGLIDFIREMHSSRIHWPISNWCK